MICTWARLRCYPNTNTKPPQHQTSPNIARIEALHNRFAPGHDSGAISPRPVRTKPPQHQTSPNISRIEGTGQSICTWTRLRCYPNTNTKPPQHQTNPNISRIEALHNRFAAGHDCGAIPPPPRPNHHNTKLAQIFHALKHRTIDLHLDTIVVLSQHQHQTTTTPN